MLNSCLRTAELLITHATPVEAFGILDMLGVCCGPDMGVNLAVFTATIAADRTLGLHLLFKVMAPRGDEVQICVLTLARPLDPSSSPTLARPLAYAMHPLS
jgi:hypothetical protein